MPDGRLFIAYLTDNRWDDDMKTDIVRGFSMKALVIVLTGLFLFLQYKLWFEQGGISEVWHLRQAIAKQTAENEIFVQENTVLANEVRDLKNGTAAVEAHARNDLGMTKPGEAYYQIVQKP